LIEIGLKTAEKNSAQTNTDRHYGTKIIVTWPWTNILNQQCTKLAASPSVCIYRDYA